MAFEDVEIEKIRAELIKQVADRLGEARELISDEMFDELIKVSEVRVLKSLGRMSPEETKIKSLEANNNLLRAEITSLKEWKKRIEPVLKNAIDNSLELKKKCSNS